MVDDLFMDDSINDIVGRLTRLTNSGYQLQNGNYLVEFFLL